MRKKKRYTIQETADILGVSRQDVYHRIKLAKHYPRRIEAKQDENFGQLFVSQKEIDRITSAK